MSGNLLAVFRHINQQAAKLTCSNLKTSMVKSYGVPILTFIPILTFCMLGKNFRWHFEINFLLYPENRIWHLMQIVSRDDNLHDVSDPIF